MNESFTVNLVKGGVALPIDELDPDRGLVLENESSAWPRSWTLEFDTPNPITRLRMRDIQRRERWREWHFELKAVRTEQGGLAFKGVKRDALPTGESRQMIHEPTLALQGTPRRLEILFTGRPADPGHPPEVEVQRRLQLDAVRRWYGGDWTPIEAKLRTSIIDGISVFLSLFDDDPSVKYSFCPPEACHAPIGTELLRVVGYDGDTGRYRVDQRDTSENVA